MQFILHVPTFCGLYFACPVLSLSCTLHSCPPRPLSSQYSFEIGKKPNYQKDSIMVKKMRDNKYIQQT